MTSRTPATPGTFTSSTPLPQTRPVSEEAQDVPHPACSLTPQQHHQYLANMAASQMAVKRDLGKDFNVGSGYSGNVPKYRVHNLIDAP